MRPAAHPAAGILALAVVFATCTSDRLPARVDRPTGVVRVDQVGYAVGETKHAYLMTSVPAAGASFTVVDASGRAVLTGRAGASLGQWSARFPAVHPLDVSALTAAGTYRIRVTAPVTTTSPPFRVATAGVLFGPVVDRAVTYFPAQRDGARLVPGILDRRPSHLRDRAATVYATPAFSGPDGDLVEGALTPVGGPVDVEGGWFDAGDYLKFTHTAAYADALLFLAHRYHGSPALLAEARYGVDWLTKMWDPTSRTLLLQVGIGSGDVGGSVVGDHDVWRLPEADDADATPAHRFLRSRPVFRAGPAGAPISPNLAGRVTAAFALAAQADAANPARARAELDTAAGILALARTRDVTPDSLVTTAPRSYYPEQVWQDDMEFGATELAVAGRMLGDPRAAGWLRQATHWAAGYLANGTGDTLNLYDTSALGHADLIAAIRAAGSPPGLEVTTAELAGDLRRQLQTGRSRAAADPFGAGVAHDDFDANSHAFGLVTTTRLYRMVTGDRSFDGFGSDQRNWVLGANPWGVSMMVGVGSVFPRCPQHQVANLADLRDGPIGSDGAAPVLTGAVVAGPNDEALFSDGLGDDQDGIRRCPQSAADPFARFTGRGSRFVDDVRAWQTNEPTLDASATALLAVALASKP